MALLGDDGRGFELARKLENQGVWRSWLGDGLYPNFIPVLSSPSSWEAFMRADDSKTKQQIQLLLRVRALLFDKASVSLFLHSPLPNSAAVAKLNPNFLELHGDDVYFTLENGINDGDQQRIGLGGSNAISKSQLKPYLGVGARFSESEVDMVSQRFKLEQFPETWYSRFLEKYRASKSYKISFGDGESEKRTPEEMSAYLQLLQKHKRRRVAFKEDRSTGFPNLVPANESNLPSSLVMDDNNGADEIPFFPETMFTLNSVPESAVLRSNRLEISQKVEFNGVLDNLPRIMAKSPIMIERLGIRPEYLSMEQGGNQSCGKNGSELSKKFLGQEQALQMSKKVVARLLTIVGFEASAEVPLEIFAQFLSCHISKLGRSLKLLADSYRKQCSAIELLKMFLNTAGYSNLGALSELVKDNTRNIAQQTQQQMQGIQSQLQLQHQMPIRQPQQIARQINPQMQPINNAQYLAFQQQQQFERMRRRQQSTPRPGMNVNMTMNIGANMNANMTMDKLVEVKTENPSDFPIDNNAFAALNSRHPQLQQMRQQHLAMMSSLHNQQNNAFRPMNPLLIPQVQSPNMGMARAPPVKVEGFQELMGGDTSMKHDSEENKLTSPSK